MGGVKCGEGALKTSNVEVSTRRFERSNSAPQFRRSQGEDDDVFCQQEHCHKPKLDLERIKCDIDARKKLSFNTELRTTLKQEILQLEKRLTEQLLVRHALEKALGFRHVLHDSLSRKSMPKPTEELIKEIAILELEVVYLEQYLLSLYRRAFTQQIPASDSNAANENLSYSHEGQHNEIAPRRANAQSQLIPSHSILFPQEPFLDCMNRTGYMSNISKQEDSGIQRCHSSLSQSSICIDKNPPSTDLMRNTFNSCHSQPLYSTEFQNGNSGVISLADHLGTSIADHVPETPNRLSEDMIRCIASIYCKIAEPPLPPLAVSSSPSSSLSSISTFSVPDLCEMWSPHGKQDATRDARLENPFCVGCGVEPYGPYSSMVEIRWICTEAPRLRSVESHLETYRSLVRRLEKVDPRKLKNEERLAFWINIHNALVMHAYLICGISQNDLKRASLLYKASYNVGGQTINAETIQRSILKCHMHRPVQWLRTLFAPKTKIRVRDDPQAYAIHHTEPLLCFALCSGCYSDPSVRVYTPKKVFQELEAAKQEFIQASTGTRNEEKVVLPRILETFARGSCLRTDDLLVMVQSCLPETQSKAIQRCLQTKSRKSVEWLAHNCSYRYLLAKELTKS